MLTFSFKMASQDIFVISCYGFKAVFVKKKQDKMLRNDFYLSLNNLMAYSSQLNGLTTGLLGLRG